MCMGIHGVTKFRINFVVEHAGDRTKGINCEHSAQSFIPLYPELKIFFPPIRKVKQTETFLLHLYFLLRCFLTYSFRMHIYLEI